MVNERRKETVAVRKRPVSISRPCGRRSGNLISFEHRQDAKEPSVPTEKPGEVVHRLRSHEQRRERLNLNR